ncbi:MAG: PepSY-associated TM helix domain-containing protein [Steroidobacteraceae bacterium]
MGIRRALFQIHLWTGLATVIYVLAICLSGSAIVFRREMNRAFCQRDGHTCEPAFVSWLAHFHGELLGDSAGRMWNGIGAIALTMMCLTGAIVWWPAKRGWWQQMSIQRGTRGRRFVRNLHNVLGFWFFILVFLWAVTGIYFAFPDVVNVPSEWLYGGGNEKTALLLEDAIASMVRLHFGRAYGLSVKMLWVILGLIPCALCITGVVMWWKRKGRPYSTSVATFGR